MAPLVCACAVARAVPVVRGHRRRYPNGPCGYGALGKHSAWSPELPTPWRPASGPPDGSCLVHGRDGAADSTAPNSRSVWEVSRQMSMLDGLEAIETASRDELAALQLDRLRWSLRHAYQNVPHYRAAFDAAGVHPEELRELADLARFPFTSKAD